MFYLSLCSVLLLAASATVKAAYVGYVFSPWCGFTALHKTHKTRWWILSMKAHTYIIK